LYLIVVLTGEGCFLLSAYFILYSFTDINLYSTLSLLLKSRILKLLLFIFMSFYTVYCMVCVMVTFLVTDVILAMIIFFVSFVKHELHFKPRKSYATNKSELRKPRILSIEYRKVELIVKAAMEFIGPLLFIAQVLVGHLGLMVNFVLVRHWDDVSIESVLIILMITIGVQVFWVCVLSLGGNTTQQFGKVVASWKYSLRTGSKRESTFMKKFRKSCRPIVIGLEGYIKLRRISACKYLYGYSRSTFRILLTIR